MSLKSFLDSINIDELLNKYRFDGVVYAQEEKERINELLMNIALLAQIYDQFSEIFDRNKEIISNVRVYTFDDKKERLIITLDRLIEDLKQQLEYVLKNTYVTLSLMSIPLNYIITRLFNLKIGAVIGPRGSYKTTMGNLLASYSRTQERIIVYYHDENLAAYQEPLLAIMRKMRDKYYEVILSYIQIYLGDIQQLGTKMNTKNVIVFHRSLEELAVVDGTAYRVAGQITEEEHAYLQDMLKFYKKDMTYLTRPFHHYDFIIYLYADPAVLAQRANLDDTETQFENIKLQIYPQLLDMYTQMGTKVLQMDTTNLEPMKNLDDRLYMVNTVITWLEQEIYSQQKEIDA